MTSPPPTGHPVRLGRFEIERELGRGGMGVVYLARDPRLERRVALKTLTEDLALDPARLAQVQREAKLLASLNHPNIAAIHGMEEDERGSRFLVLEWVDGVTLAERLQSWRPTAGEAHGLLSQIADAVAAAHRAGVIHRDLKPRNVMVLEGGRVKVLDFGLARRAEGRMTDVAEGGTWIDSGISGIDGSHMLFGTAGYLSPERILGEAEDGRSDVFSFGCVAFEALSGAPAFHGTSVLGVLIRVVRGEPDWSALPRDTPAELRALLAACLEKSREKRPATMEAVARALGRARGRRRDPLGSDPAESATPHNLPRFLTSFVGRDLETTECLRLLAGTRLLSLTGPGGCGKTRLAVRVAELALDRSWRGIWFAGLAAVQDPARVADAVAAALDLRPAAGVPPARALADRLGDEPAILMLDNCEHVRDAAAGLVAELLERCRALTVIVTSREELRVGGERLYPVPTMAVPETHDASPEDAVRYESVRLFEERAAAADQRFGLTADNVRAVVEICRRVDGIPLAIELAAARVRVLGPPEIAARLDQQLRLLKSDATGSDPRHETLRSMIAWSVDLLSASERRTLDALAVFAGGWTLASAAAVLQADDFDILDTMAGLVGRSLVVTERPKEQSSRYRYLEPVRQYALESLSGSASEGEARDRHLDYFVDFANEAQQGSVGPEQAHWLERLELDHDNLLAALDWCARAGSRAAKAQALAGSLAKFWYVHGHVPIGQAALTRALALPGGEARTSARARALYGAGVLAAFDNEGPYRAAPLFAEALEVARGLGDKRESARCLVGLAAVASRRGEHEQATAWLEEAEVFFRETGDRLGRATTLANLAAGAWRRGDLAHARAIFETCLLLYREIGELNNLAQASIGLTFVTTRLGDVPAALAALAEALDLLQRLNARSTNVAGTIIAAAELATARARYEPAARLFGAADALLVQLGLHLEATDVWWHDHDRSVEKIRTALGAEPCGALWEEGRALSWNAALEQSRASLAPGLPDV